MSVPSTHSSKCPESVCPQHTLIEESNLRGLIGIFAREIDGLAPRGLLAAVEFTEVKHLALKHPSS